jgi:hypothetical protein
MAVRIEKVIATVLDEAHKRQVEEVMGTLQEGPDGPVQAAPLLIRDLATKLHLSPTFGQQVRPPEGLCARRRYD